MAIIDGRYVNLDAQKALAVDKRRNPAKYQRKKIPKHLRLQDTSRLGGFGTFGDQAYDAERGYRIRTNPLTGEKEMFVAGTRNAKDWLANLTEGVWMNTGLRQIPIDPFRYRTRYSKELSDIAKEKGVTRVFGHSRGAALVNDMQGDFEKVGLDGAMMLAKDKNMMNLTGAGMFRHDPKTAVFDGIIGATGKANIPTETTGFHRVYSQA